MSKEVFETKEKIIQKAKEDKSLKVKLESEKLYHHIYKKWRTYDTMTTILSSVGFILAIILYEMNVWKNEFVDIEEFPNAMDNRRFDNFETRFLRIIIFITSIMAVISLIIRHYYKHIWLTTFFNPNNDPFSNILSEQVIINEKA